MKKFRLKKEAIPFFKESLATQIHHFDTWEKYGIDMNALEEVEEVHLTYGHKTSKNSSNLNGWDEDGSRFLFTIHFPSVKHFEHDKFSDGKTTRKLMAIIQNDINDFYFNFSSNNESER